MLVDPIVDPMVVFRAGMGSLFGGHCLNVITGEDIVCQGILIRSFISFSVRPFNIVPIYILLRCLC